MAVWRRAVWWLLGGCALSGAVHGEGENCHPAPEYTGINAVPAVTMQILPSAHGDTVANDAEHPPGKGPYVVVGYWEYPATVPEGENPCAGEPLMKIAFPVEFGSEQCYAWKHWVLGEEPEKNPHKNSATNFSCQADGSFKFEQWPDTMDCAYEEEAAKGGRNPQPKWKTAKRGEGCMDTPSPNEEAGVPALYSQILSGCGKEGLQVIRK